MKMENEIHAGMAGRVARIAAAVAQPVQAGDLLIVLEPEPPAR
jgi:biotin carboxyl carrier protein